MPRAIHTLVAEAEREFGPVGAARLAEAVRNKARRMRILRECPTPGVLAQRLVPTTIQTPMLDRVDAAIVAADAGEQRRWIINTPPQEGKSTRICRDAALWLLLRNPDRRIVIASYQQNLAEVSTLGVRRLIETYGSRPGDPEENNLLGLSIERTPSAAGNWRVAGREGGMIAVGIGSGTTGRPGDVIVVDDPLADAEAADSPVQRKKVIDWWTTVIQSRLVATSLVVVVQCLTGDTPVLMGDGIEHPLRDVRPGDTVATFEDGALTTSTVRNWANQGPDFIYRIKMKSGREVRANARHPFLTIEGEEWVWRRTDQLVPGSVIQTVTGGNGAVSPASGTGATIPCPARACASRTTTSSAGRTDTVEARQRSDARPTSSTDTASPLRSTTPSWPPRMAAAPSVAAAPRRSPVPNIGATCFASTTTTTPARTGDSCATTATSSLPEDTPPMSSAPPLTTWSATPDEVTEVVPCGVEDVYDLQIDRTENFIANGLVSHNTRWNEEDLSGWLKANDGTGTGRDAPRYQVLSIPAQAEADDPLGREVGEWLTSARERTVEEWEDTRKEIVKGGIRWWFALYQQRPAPPSGDTFHLDWFDRDRVWERPPGPPPVVVIDPADNTGSGDEAGILVASTDTRNHIYLGPDYSGHYTVGRWVRVALLAVARHKAGSLVYEQSLSGLARDVAFGWEQLHKQARILRRLKATDVLDPDIVESAVTELCTPEDSTATRDQYRAEIVEVWPLVQQILDYPSTGPSIRRIIPKGTKAWRAQAASPRYEHRGVSHIGDLSVLEHQMVTWMPGQKSPDRMDTAVHAVLLLSGATVAVLSVPDKSQELPTRSTRLAKSRGGALPRSTMSRR